MADRGFIPKEKWGAFIEGLSKKATLHVPCREGDTVVFRPFSPERTLCFERPANMPPKSVIFPQSETLFSFRFKKDPENPQRVTVELEERLDFPETIILGGRPCDARGFTVYDRPYIEAAAKPDPYYKGRREKTIIVTIACESPYTGCFCTAVGGGPADTKGSDVIITPLEHGYFIEALTEKGRAIVQDAVVEDGGAYQAEAEKKHVAARAAVNDVFRVGGKPRVSQERFESAEFWEKAVAKCVSCGACTYLCPTCYCFNMTDEQTIDKGERIRSWDGCMYPHFTLEASGHNPRPRKQDRFKNRVGHKFCFYPETYRGEIACSGCGRCIRFCPVSMDLREIVLSLLERPEGPAMDEGNDANTGSKPNAS